MRIAIYDYIRFYISSVCGSVLPISWVNVELVGTYVDLMITFAITYENGQHIDRQSVVGFSRADLVTQACGARCYVTTTTRFVPNEGAESNTATEQLEAKGIYGISP